MGAEEEYKYMCAVCGKQYKLEHWYSKHLINEHDIPLEETFKNGRLEYLQRCPNCGKLVPNSNVGCLNCGYILDSHLRTLAGLKKGEIEV